ncbi:MAG: transcription antitermination factor NusB [Woeseiaceae bacterium]|nr:transcription antitermination factor NusB [Woeseiaceae bacterium]
MSKASSKGTGARTRARELLVQALYQKQIAGHSCSELLSQFHEQAAYARVDQVFFDEQLAAICETQDKLENTVDGLIDRPLDQLDPVERGILLIGAYELASRIDIPYKVVINECVNLAKRFGSVDGHKYVNACLDVAAKTLREDEVQANAGG